MFTLTSNRNLKYEYAKALQVCDLLSNWVHPSKMPAFASKDKWWLEVSEQKKKKKKGKKNDEERYFEIFKGLRKIYILEVRVPYLLKPYLFFIALTIAIHHKPNKDILILGNILFYISGEWFNKLLEFWGIHSYLLVCIKLSRKLMMKWEW